MILSQSPKKIKYTLKGQRSTYGCRRHRHGKDGTALEPLRLWTSSIDELFYIEQRLYTAKVWHVGQSWTEATEHFKFMQDKNGPTASSL